MLLIEGDILIKYELKNITKRDDLYKTFFIKFDDDISCYFYESLDNKYVNVIEIIMEGYKQKSIENNNIYVFLRKNDNIYNLVNVLEYFNKEYNNLKFNYRGFSSSYYDDINKISKRLNLNYEIISVNSVAERRNNTNNNSYVDYDLSDNELLKKDEEENKIDKDLIKDSANYNGYNERLIDKNVKKIVSFNFNKKNNN